MTPTSLPYWPEFIGYLPWWAMSCQAETTGRWQCGEGGGLEARLCNFHQGFFFLFCFASEIEALDGDLLVKDNFSWIIVLLIICNLILCVDLCSSRAQHYSFNVVLQMCFYWFMELLCIFMSLIGVNVFFVVWTLTGGNFLCDRKYILLNVASWI